MDFSLSDPQNMLRDSVRRYCTQAYDLKSRQEALRSALGYSERHWAAFADFGWLGVSLPEESGGSAGTLIEAALILEEFGRVLVLEPFLASAILAAQTISHADAPGAHTDSLRSMIAGKLILALAHAEPAPAKGEAATAVTYRAVAGGYRLNGAKKLVLGGNRAQRFIVSARAAEDGGQRDAAVTLFLVEASARGLTPRNYRLLDGSGAADLVLDEVEVAASRLLGKEGEGLASVEYATDFAITAVCAEAVGAMDTLVTTTADYLKTRRAYNTTLSTFQALQHQLADMLIELEMSRSIVHRALAGFALGDPIQRRHAASAAKSLVGRAGKFVAARAIQLHGGLGMVDDYIIGQQFKRLTVIEALFGNSDFHLLRRYRTGPQ